MSYNEVYNELYKNNIEVELDLGNHAIKSELKMQQVGTFQFAKEVDLVSSILIN